MANNGLRCPLFVLDETFMKNIIEGRLNNNRVFVELMKRHSQDLPYAAYTTYSCFKRAIYLCGDTGAIKNIKFLMELVKIFPSNANYKNAQDVKKELDKMVKLWSQGDL